MKSKPFSLRLSDAVSDLITTQSKKHSKSASEIVRDAVEFMYKDQLGVREAYLELMKKPELTISNIKTTIYSSEQPLISHKDKTFSREEMMFIAHSLHDTYSNGTNANTLLNHKYMGIILTMTFELMMEINQNKSANAEIIGYCLNTLGLDNTSDWEKSLTKLIDKFYQSPNSGYADFLTRPITVLLESNHLPTTINLHHIFTLKRIKALLPVLTYGLRRFSNEGKYFKNNNELLYSTFPQPVRLLDKKDELSITLHSKNLYLLMSTPHCHNVWSIDAVFDLMAYTARHESNIDSSYKGKTLNFLTSNHLNRIEIYENESSYRFFCSHNDFNQLCSELLKLRKNPEWESVFLYYLSEQGDI